MNEEEVLKLKEQSQKILHETIYSKEPFSDGVKAFEDDIIICMIKFLKQQTTKVENDE